ncbi:hypothetical protein CYMTET_39114 [Cymbomonas tetramitiformis]|uniref:Uncharacterized protein n=1 Tax=Cymbomonas tetramitiformis TaxID=36881 RepID=A0AAE0CCE7_9CHLO|nr:hypothetical protein CYMTET_39114 [Cymbomonas tetramitiformis]
MSDVEVEDFVDSDFDSEDDLDELLDSEFLPGLDPSAGNSPTASKSYPEEKTRSSFSEEYLKGRASVPTTSAQGESDSSSTRVPENDVKSLSENSAQLDKVGVSEKDAEPQGPEKSAKLRSEPSPEGKAAITEPKLLFKRMQTDGTVDRTSMIASLRNNPKVAKQMLYGYAFPMEGTAPQDEETIFMSLEFGDPKVGFEEYCSYFGLEVSENEEELEEEEEEEEAEEEAKEDGGEVEVADAVAGGTDKASSPSAPGSGRALSKWARRKAVEDDMQVLLGELKEQFALAQATSLQSFSEALGFEGLEISGNPQMELLIGEAFKPLEAATREHVETLQDLVYVPEQQAPVVDTAAKEECKKLSGEVEALREELDKARAERERAETECLRLRQNNDEFMLGVQQLAALVPTVQESGKEAESPGVSEVEAPKSSSGPESPAVKLKGVTGRVAELINAFVAPDYDSERIHQVDTEIGYLTGLLETASVELETTSSALAASKAEAQELKASLVTAQRRGDDALENFESTQFMLKTRSERCAELTKDKTNALTRAEKAEAEILSLKAEMQNFAERQDTQQKKHEKAMERVEKDLEDQLRANRVLALENHIAVEHLRKNKINIEFPEVSAIEDVVGNYGSKTTPPPCRGHSPGSPAPGSTSPRHFSENAPLCANKPGIIMADDPKFWRACETWKAVCNTVLNEKKNFLTTHNNLNVNAPGSPDGVNVRVRTPTFMRTEAIVETRCAATLETLVTALRRCLTQQGMKLPMEKVADFKYTLGSKVYTLKVTNGELVVRKGGGYMGLIDVIGCLPPVHE